MNKFFLFFVTLIFSLMVIANQQLCQAQEIGIYKLEDVVKGKKVQIEVVDYFLSRISQHAKEWPLKFDYEGQREVIEHELKSIILALEMALDNYPSEQEILWRLIFAHSMAYNLDIPGSAEATDKYFKLLSLLNPNHPQGIFLFGAHLTGIPGKQKESIPYLEKAVSFGYDEAIYMLGFTYLHLYNDKKAIEYFQQYLDKHPDSTSTKEMIEGVKQGKVKLHQEFLNKK